MRSFDFCVYSFGASDFPCFKLISRAKSLSSQCDFSYIYIYVVLVCKLFYCFKQLLPITWRNAVFEVYLVTGDLPDAENKSCKLSEFVADVIAVVVFVYIFFIQPSSIRHYHGIHFNSRLAIIIRLRRQKKFPCSGRCTPLGFANGFAFVPFWNS